MRRFNHTLLLILVASMLVLIGCKGDEPAAEVDKPRVRQPEQSAQPDQPADKAAAEQAAIEAAEAWLKILDAGEYAKTRNEAAEYFRSAVAKERWETSLAASRRPLGKLVSRKLLSKKHLTRIPNAPPGEYVIIQYETRFANRSAAVETITPMLDKDGKWRVSGYYIR